MFKMDDIMKRRTFLVLLISVICSPFPLALTGEQDYNRCPGYGWYPYTTSKCFKIMKTFATGGDAEYYCDLETTKYSSSVPASIKTKEEQDFLTELVFNKTALRINVWIGLRKYKGASSSEEAGFTWNDGSRVTYSNWADASPSEDLEMDCVEMVSHLSKVTRNDDIPVEDGQWRDVSCEKANYVLCEKFQIWSRAELQKELLEHRLETDLKGKEVEGRFEKVKFELENKEAKIGILTNELDATIHELTDTKADLITTNFALTNTKTDLASTKSDLDKTKADLGATKSDLAKTNSALKSTKSELSNTKSDLEETKNQLGGTKGDLLNTKMDLQQTKSDLAATKSSLANTEYELANTNSVLGITKSQLRATKSDLENTTADLSRTKTDLKLTKSNLENVKSNLASTIVDLDKTKVELGKTQADLEDVKIAIVELEANSVPVGFTYLQLGRMPPPTEIWPNMTWEDVSYLYAGQFFRVVGSGSLDLGQIQQASMPLFTAAETSNNITQILPYVNFQRGSWSDAILSGHDIGHRLGIRFHMTGDEIRPVNQAIRVWKRVS